MTTQTMHVKPITLALALALVSNMALAEWTKVSASEDGKVSQYADITTRRPVGSNVQLRTMTDYLEAQEISAGKTFRSVTMQDEFNCEEGSGRHLSLVAKSDNMGEGKTVAVEMKPAPVRPIREGSADVEMLKFACARN